MSVIEAGAQPMSIDTLLDLSPDQCRAFQISEADQGKLKIYEHAGYRWLSTHDAAIQSIVKIDSPADLLLPNHAAMLMGLLMNESPHQILNLGFGTGAFERFFHHRLPTLNIVSVDCNPIMADLAREYFFVPHDWPVQIQSAEDYLEHSNQTFDVILCDIFAGESHPQCLFDASFYRAAAQRLTGAGVMSLNLYPRSEAEIVSILLAVRQSYPWVMLVKIPRHSNMVLLACTQPLPSDAELAQRADQLTKRLHLNFDYLLKQLERLPQPPVF